MKTKSYVIYFIIIGFVLTGSVSKLEVTGFSEQEQVTMERIIVRGWEIITIRESSELVYIICEPIIDSIAQLDAYKNSRITVLHNISNVMNPEDEIGAAIILNYPLSFNESVILTTKYEFTLHFYEYIGNKGNQGGISLLTGETFEEREEMLKQMLGEDFKIIGITMLQGSMPVKNLLAVQNDPTVFLVDIGPPELYEELGKGKKVVAGRPNIYFALTKSLPPTTSLPPATTLYITYTHSTTTGPASTTTVSSITRPASTTASPSTTGPFVITTTVTTIISIPIPLVTKPWFTTAPSSTIKSPPTTAPSSTITPPSTTVPFLATTTTFTPLTTTSQRSIQVEEFRYNGFFVVLELIVLFTGLQLLRLSHRQVQRRPRE